MPIPMPKSAWDWSPTAISATTTSPKDSNSPPISRISTPLCWSCARAQLQQIGVEILDIGGEFESFGDVVVADIAVGDQSHADFGIGIGIDDRGGDRPDFAFGALNQRAHRAGGVEHERDFDHGLTRDRLGGGLNGPNERQHKKSESRSPRALSKHEFTPSGGRFSDRGMVLGHRVGRGPELRPAIG